MKEVYFYATCQGVAIRNMLNKNINFTKIFRVTGCARNYVHIRDNKPLIEDMGAVASIRKADVFIYQPLEDFYGQHSSNKFLPLLKPSCVKISIPYIINNSLWPIFKIYKRDLGDWLDGERFITHNTAPVNNLLDNGYSIDKIISMFDSNEIDWDFNKRHEVMMEYLRHQEKDTDIKICDFIDRNIHNIRLFEFFSHPSLSILSNMVNQICDILRILKYTHDYQGMSLYPPQTFSPFPTCSVSHFKLNFVGEAERQTADNFYRNLIIDYCNEHRK